MAEVIKPLPPEAAVLPAWRRLYYQIAANRIRIGIALFAITTFVATFVDDADVKGHRRLHAIELLIFATTGATAGMAFGGGKFKSNEFHEDEMQQEIRSTSSEIPIPVLPMRRASDKE
jgi:hypothetical protein